MPKTRAQKLAAQIQGQAPSPPQSLPASTRVKRVPKSRVKKNTEQDASADSTHREATSSSNVVDQPQSTQDAQVVLAAQGTPATHAEDTSQVLQSAQVVSATFTEGTSQNTSSTQAIPATQAGFLTQAVPATQAGFPTHNLPSVQVVPATQINHSAQTTQPSQVLLEPHVVPSSQPVQARPSQPYALIHIWLHPTTGDLASSSPSAAPTITAALPLTTTNDFLSSLLPESRKLTVDTASSPASKRKLDEVATNFADEMPAAKSRRTAFRNAVRGISRPAYTKSGNLILGPAATLQNNLQDNGEGMTNEEMFRDPLFPFMPVPSILPLLLSDEQDEQALNKQPVFDENSPVPSVLPLLLSDEQDEQALKEQPVLDENSPGSETGSADNTESVVVADLPPAVVVHDATESIPSSQPKDINGDLTLVPETPKRRGWGLSNLVPNIPQSVAKYLPRVPAFNLEALTQNHTGTDDTPATAGPSKIQGRKDRRSPPSFQTKAQRDVARLAKEKQIVIAKEKMIIEEEVTRQVQEKMELAEITRKVEQASNPGQKRKRVVSPQGDEKIPVPEGCQFGMDLDYFCSSSSDESSDEDVPDTPTRKPQTSSAPRATRPIKRLRFSDEVLVAPAYQIVGDPHRAQPYTGVLLARPGDLGYKGGNMFTEATVKGAAASEATSASSSSKNTNPQGTFICPSASDSEEDIIDAFFGEKPLPSSKQKPTFNTPASNTHKSTNTTTKIPGLFASTPLQSIEANKITITTAKPAESWTQPPPPRPNPSHAALPSGNSHVSNVGSYSSGNPASNPTEMDPLTRARSAALKYTPAKPSGLRESSRLSSTTVSDHGDQEQSLGACDDHVTAKGQTQEEIENPEKPQVDYDIDGASAQEDKRKGKENEMHTKLVPGVERENPQYSTFEQDAEVEAAVAAIPDQDLIQFDWSENSIPLPTLSEDDAEVEAAVAAIPDQDLIQFDWSENSIRLPTLSEDDAEVEAYLDMVCQGPEFEEEARQNFADSYAAWLSNQHSPTNSALTAN